MAAVDPKLEAEFDEYVATAAANAVEVRRAIHRHPELGWNEHRTQARLRERLEALGFAPRDVARTGLVAELGEGPLTVLYRADMDALPIEDLKAPQSTPVVSEVSGVSHACGHDLHCALAVGLAEVFSQMVERLPGRVRFAFQPAEEVIPSGAEVMVREGAADGVRACVGVHADPMRQVGHVGVRHGPMTAAGDAFHIEIEGQGGHASRPYLARNPIVAASRAIGALHSVVGQRVDPLEPAVITVTRVSGGSADNVIPSRVSVGGTIRTFNEDTRRRLHHAVEEVANAAATTQGCIARVTIELGAPPLINDLDLDYVVRHAALDTLGEPCIEEVDRPSTGSEDFSYFGTKAPAYMLRLGVRRPGHAPAHLHTGEFDPDENAIEVGIRVMGRSILRLLGGA